MLRYLINSTLACCGLIVFSPILATTAILIKLDSNGSVFFKHKRVGLHGEEFDLWKFRSMHVNAKGLDLTSGASDPRITRVGHYIRKFHLDELVQLINVIKGDMDIVGPRPESPKYVSHYKDKWNIVLSIKPGITGLSAVEYSRQEYKLLKDAKDPEDTYIKKILPHKLDIEIGYIKKRSLFLDIKILLKTLALLVL